jgi:acetylornithine deacetylase
MNPPATAPRVPPIESLELIRTLVAYDTTSRDSNLGLIHWVRDYLGRHGIASQLTYDDERRKANLFATLPAQDGNAMTGGVVVSGHTDVVPVDGQAWDTAPFEATLVGDRLQGRGVTDMKSFCAIALAQVPELLRRGLRRPLHFALSYDEEIGCIGVRRLIADVAARQIRPSACVIGEPSGMRVVVAHKGKRSYRCRVRGHEAHSALTPLGVNAIQVASEIVTFLGRMGRQFRERGPFDAAYEVPYTTVHTGVMHGGTALNIVPRDCRFDFEFRHLPSENPDVLLAEVKRFAATLLPEMHAVDSGTHIEFDTLSATPGFEGHQGGDIAELGKQWSGTRDVGKVSFGSEAALFHNAGVPTIICGPGNIAQAHQPNEWVALDQLALCEQFMHRMADDLCAA